jgi:chromosome segregation ATPase
MKNPIYLLALSVSLLFATMFTSCQSSSEKVEEASEDVQDAKEDLQDAKSDAAAENARVANEEEWRMFRSENDVVIRSNETRIAELKANMKKSEKAADKAYAERINALEQRNKELNDRMSNYESNQSDWESFKREFKHDMDAIGQGFNDLTVNNKR